MKRSDEFAANAPKAALLCKSDLTSQMVQEFPELEGIIGGIYARASGEKEEVCVAIHEHHLPKGMKDPVPTSQMGILLSLYDKLDTLYGFLTIAQIKPNGSKDPMGLRRLAIGIVRIICENQQEINLVKMLFEVRKCYMKQGFDTPISAVSDVLKFISDKMANYEGSIPE